MPVHIAEMTSEVTVIEGDFPLNEVQIEKLVKLIAKRLADRELEAQRSRDATKLKRQSSSSFEPGA